MPTPDIKASDLVPVLRWPGRLPGFDRERRGMKQKVATWWHAAMSAGQCFFFPGNGQWSMPMGTGGERKTALDTLFCINSSLLTSGKKKHQKNSKKSSSPWLVKFRLFQPWPSAFVLTNRFDLSAWPPSKRSASHRWFQARILRTPRCSGKFAMRHANFQCCLQIRSARGSLGRLGPDRCSDDEFPATRGDGPVFDEVVTIDRQNLQNRTVLCTGYDDHLGNKPLLIRKHWNISVSYSFVQIEIILSYNLRWVQSWSRRLAAKACNAAWVNRAVHRLMRADATECLKKAAPWGIQGWPLTSTAQVLKFQE